MSVNSFGRPRQRLFKLSTQKPEDESSRTTLFYKDCAHKTTLGPSVMSEIVRLRAAEAEQNRNRKLVLTKAITTLDC